MINSIQEQIKELAHISLEFMFGENVASPELEAAVYDAIEDKAYRGLHVLYLRKECQIRTPCETNPA